MDAMTLGTRYTIQYRCHKTYNSIPVECTPCSLVHAHVGGRSGLEQNSLPDLTALLASCGLLSAPRLELLAPRFSVSSKHREY
eukprot:6487173-Amphidinium_carterae.2